MSAKELPSNTVPITTVKWDQDLVYFTPGDPVRRRLLFVLAKGGKLTANDLKMSVNRKLDAPLKHLTVMRKAGLVVQSENPSDGRGSLYALHPAVPVTRDGDGVTINFGFCLNHL